MTKHLLTSLVLAVAVGCGGGTTTETPTPTPAPATTEAPATTPPPVEPAAATTPAAAAAPADVLRNPKKATLTAPAEYTVKLETTKGDVLVDVHRDWSPKGADRFYNLVKAGFYDDTAFFRVVPGFVAQIGIPGDPEIAATWREATIDDDPVRQSNLRGTVVFAKTNSPNSRTTQIFFNFVDNANLDQMGFSPFGQVRDMAPVDAINAEYGQTPNQAAVQTQGNAYLKGKFPNLDYIKKATVLE